MGGWVAGWVGGWLDQLDIRLSQPQLELELWLSLAKMTANLASQNHKNTPTLKFLEI